MKQLKRTTGFLLVSTLMAALVSCEKEAKPPADTAAPVEKAANQTLENQALKELRAADMPLLPISKGDFWKYSLRVEIPAGVTSESAAAMDVIQEMLRTYVGKVHVADGLPETDAFDVEVQGMPTQRELVEIYDNRIMMRGTMTPQMLDSKPMWLDTPVVFVFAGMRPGEDAVNLSAAEGERTRGIKVVGRETVKTPAGEYSAIRLLTTGRDGEFELRKTTWFAPQIGIVKEEKARYAADKLLYRETLELTETSVRKAK